VAGSEARDAWPKPLDVGNGQVCASFAVDGSWLSLGRPHPGRGFVELTGAPPFDEALRGRPDAVRRHRHQLTLAANAALRLTGAVPEVAPDPGPPGRPRWSGADRAGSYRAEAWAAAGRPAVTQRHVWRAGPDRRPRRLVLVASARLQRPPFAEITEVSPLPPLPSLASTTAQGTVLDLRDRALPAAARLEVVVAGGDAEGWRVDADAARLPIAWDPGREPTLEVTVTCALAPDDPPAPGPPDPPGGPPDPPGARRSRAGPPPTGLHLPARLRPRLSRLVDGVLGYVLGCTALAVAPGERCVVTDHRLLQLSWTRDAYYQARLLLAARHLEPGGLPVVAEDLRWLWVRCDRAGGWMRSHLPNGAVKDRAFQADQQLYPVLELLDYREAAGAWPEVPPGRAGWGEAVAETWRALPIDPELGLVAGEENPADDPASLPISCPPRSCSGTPPSGCAPTRTSSRWRPGRWPRPPTPCAPRSGTASPARARSAASGPMRPTPAGGPGATTTPTTSRPSWRPCGGCAPPTTGSGRPRCGSPSTRPTPAGRPGGGAASARPTPRAPGRWGTSRNGWPRACWATPAAPSGRSTASWPWPRPTACSPRPTTRAGRWLARPWFAWPGATLAALALGAWTRGLGGAASG
jgi:hypothetical protein